ncbi:MAG: Rpn family recombination-promoting nuclease/putative transposase [Fibrobacter sp.]|nr:Rpn family recombination-promoting nuclease/putative transposase [Fibrobacter sp.]
MNKMKHDPFFRWLFAVTARLRFLLELAGKVNRDVSEFLAAVNLDTLVRIPDTYSEVDETGEADLAFRVSVSSGAPVLVGVLLEHKSRRDPDVLNQIARYVNSVMKMHDKNRGFDGLPTMAIIFYNGRENWDPLKLLDKGYPEFFHGSALPFRCAFVNMADIPDSDCLACEDVATGMGIVAMKYAFYGSNLLEVLPKFKDSLKKLPSNEAVCLLQKISVYLKEYINEDVLKELDMAFVSIGQKCGFVNAGDIHRKEIADTKAETHAQDKKNAVSVLKDMGMSSEQIAEFQAKLEAKSAEK